MIHLFLPIECPSGTPGGQMPQPPTKYVYGQSTLVYISEYRLCNKKYSHKIRTYVRLLLLKTLEFLMYIDKKYFDQ